MENLSAKKGITIGDVLIYTAITLYALFCILPFIMIVSSSFTSEVSLVKDGIALFPREFSLDAWKYIFKNAESIINGYKVSLFVTIVGTLVSLVITLMMAYPLSRKDVKYRNIIAFFAYFTMIFQSGMVPWYIVVTQVLHLQDKIWGLILPYALNVWNMLLLRNFLQTIPQELYESASIDGAGEFRVLFQIILPLSVPGIATIGLYYMIAYWNDWWLSLMLVNKEELFPLQMLLRRILTSVDYYVNNSQDTAMANYILPAEGVKMATALVTMGPILLVYPFIQKYFIKGLMVGAVKG